MLYWRCGDECCTGRRGGWCWDLHNYFSAWTGLRKTVACILRLKKQLIAYCVKNRSYWPGRIDAKSFVAVENYHVYHQRTVRRLMCMLNGNGSKFNTWASEMVWSEAEHYPRRYSAYCGQHSTSKFFGHGKSSCLTLILTDRLTTEWWLKCLWLCLGVNGIWLYWLVTREESWQNMHYGLWILSF